MYLLLHIPRKNICEPIGILWHVMSGVLLVLLKRLSVKGWGPYHPRSLKIVDLPTSTVPEANIALEIGWLEDEIEKLGFAFDCFMGCTMEFINIIHHHLRDNNMFGICSKHRFVLINGQEEFYGFPFHFDLE